MKHVVIIGPAHPLRGGLASYNERLAKEFNNQGWNTEIYTFSLQYPGFLFPGTTQYSEEPVPKDLKINICINSINPINWIIIGNKLKNLKPDLILVRYWLPFMGPCLGTILRRVRKNNHTKIICIADNVIPHESRPGDKQFTSYFLKPIHAFITMSEKVMMDLKMFISSPKVKFVPHPLYDNFGDKIDKLEARKKLNLPIDQKIVLFFGFIRKYKGLDLLLKSIPLLKTKNVKICIAGEYYEDNSFYEEIISDLNISSSLYMHTQFIADSQVKYYLSSADVVIQPYKNATQSGVTPLAYHFEIPMIVTNVGALPSLVPHDKVGLVCEPNPESIAKSIDEFFLREESHWLTNIQIEKKKLSWSNMLESIVSLSHDLEK
ncbi:MAG: glycosyltransferase [Saprospiraceae bacterium]|nr:glycosyltransferase [Saprospiraceae bacterium]